MKIKLKNILLCVPFAPICLGISAILSIFLHNIGELSIYKLTIPSIVTVLLSFIVSLFFIFVFNNKNKGEIFSSIFIILFFSYGLIIPNKLQINLSVVKVNLGKDYIFFPIWIMTMLIILFFLKRSGRRFSTIHHFFHVLAIITLVIPLVGIVNYQLRERFHPIVKSQLPLPSVKSTLPYLPDVYYIIPDSYASPYNLSTYFSYDNSDFITYLKRKDFYIASDSTSNYPTTLLSVASTLNMEYIDYLSSHKNSSDMSIASPLIENNNVLKLFRSLGYKYYQMGSWWSPTQYNPLADDNYNIQKENRLGIDDFSYTILESTMIHPLIERLLPEKVIGESDTDKRTIVLYQFKAIPEVAKLPGPKFVFVHIISPHGPYVFDKDCRYTSYARNWSQPEVQNYVDQVNCINNKLVKAIDTILQSSSQPPIIILQADEGAKFIADELKPSENWQRANPDILKKKFPILSAYYLPGVTKEKIYPSITPVNSFRMIFNLYFSAQMPLLPDKNYIYLDAKHLYDFKEVTQDIKE